MGGTLFSHMKHHKVTWVSVNKIDHICIIKTWRRLLLDVRKNVVPIKGQIKDHSHQEK
jgi:hypothetical protein